MMFIDLPDGKTTLMPFTNDVLEAARMAKKEKGRLRLVVSRHMSTSDPMVGCQQLCDYRPKNQTGENVDA